MRRCPARGPARRRGRGGAARRVADLEVDRDGDAVLARTALGRPRRVLLAGHLDTVPIADNVPSRVDGDVLYGCGTSDMKSGVAVLLRLGAALAATPGLADDVTLVFYDNEEIEATRNGLGRVGRAPARSGWPPTSRSCWSRPPGWSRPAARAPCGPWSRTTGRRAHTARSWLGVNAIHAAARCWPGWPRTSRARSTSTAAPTGRGSTRSASPAGWPATCCRTSAWSRSTSASRRTGPRPTPPSTWPGLRRASTVR